MEARKYYWLRLDRNFFKRHDIRIVEDMPNGKEYVLFYMKLLLESIDHEGSLRFNDLVPYNDQMLSTVTNTNIDIVRSAIKVFQTLDLLQIWDDKTIYVNDTTKMLGESKSTHRVQKYRERQKNLLLEERNVTETLHETEIELEIEKEIDIEKDKDIEQKRKRFTPPTQQELETFIKENNYAVDAQKFLDHYEMVGWHVGNKKMVDWKAAVRKWNSNNYSKKPSYQKNVRVEQPLSSDREVVKDMSEDELESVKDAFRKLVG